MFKKIETKNGVKFNAGFAVLFSVLLASFLITLGISIFNISLKEIMITTSVRDSQIAYYIADSASECALYWDRKGTFPACEVTLGGNMICDTVQDLKPKIKCNGNEVELVFTKDSIKPIYSTGVVPSFFQASSSISTPASDLQIIKEFVPGNSSIKTTIDTYGHNTKILGRRIERGIRTVFDSSSNSVSEPASGAVACTQEAPLTQPLVCPSGTSGTSIQQTKTSTCINGTLVYGDWVPATNPNCVASVPGLTWSADLGDMNWDSAFSKCTTVLTPIGMWRLPTRNEFYTAIQAKTVGEPNKTYWSGEESVVTPTYTAAYLIYGDNGGYTLGSKSLIRSVFCVH